MATYTLDEEIEELNREIKMRESVYTGLVRNGKMKPVDKVRKIGLIESTRNRLLAMRAKSGAVQPSLFSTPPADPTHE